MTAVTTVAPIPFALLATLCKLMVFVCSRMGWGCVSLHSICNDYTPAGVFPETCSTLLEACSWAQRVVGMIGPFGAEVVVACETLKFIC